MGNEIYDIVMDFDSWEFCRCNDCRTDCHSHAVDQVESLEKLAMHAQAGADKLNKFGRFTNRELVFFRKCLEAYDRYAVGPNADTSLSLQYELDRAMYERCIIDAYGEPQKFDPDSTYKYRDCPEQTPPDKVMDGYVIFPVI